MKSVSLIIPAALLLTTGVYAAPELTIGDNAEVYVGATGKIQFEDNVLLTETAAQSDMVQSITPNAELVFGKYSQFGGSVYVGETINRYSTNNSLDNELLNARYNGTYTGNKISVSTNASFAQQAQNGRDYSKVGVVATSLTKREVTNAGVNAEYALTEKSKVATGLSYSDIDYKTTGIKSYSTYTIPVNYYFAITPKVDLKGMFRYRATNVQTGVDSEDFFYGVGARGQFTEKLTGEFSVGYGQRTYDNSSSDNDQIGAQGSLAYAYSEKTRFNLTVGNDFDTASNGGTQEKFTVALGAASQINSQISLGAQLAYVEADYKNVTRKDEFVSGSISADYAYSQYLTFSLSYAYLNNDSTGLLTSFDGTIVSFAAKFRY